MLYLLLSILTATSLIVIIRLFERWDIQPRYGIVFNYIFCVVTGLFFVDDFSVFRQIPAWSGFPFVIGLGFTFMLIFMLIGKTTMTSGVAVTSIAMKVSFVIPVFSAVFLYGDSITLLKVTGIISAIIAVYMIAYVKEDKIPSPGKEKTTRSSAVTYPFLIFFICGFCDAAFNYIQKKLIPSGWDHQVTIAIFCSAASLGLLLNFHKKEMYQWKNVAAGIVLGVPNYFSLYFLLKTLNTLKWQSSVIFPVNNLGIVCLSAFIGFILFKEEFNKRKFIGFILAVASIVIIGFLS